MSFIIAFSVAAILGGSLPLLFRQPTAVLLLLAALVGMGLCACPPGLAGAPVLMGALYATAAAGYGMASVVARLRQRRREKRSPAEAPMQKPRSNPAEPLDRMGLAGVLLIAASMLLPVFQHPRFGSATIGFVSHGGGAALLLGLAALLWAPALRWYRPLAALAGGLALLGSLAAVVAVRYKAAQIAPGEITVSVAPVAAVLGGLLLVITGFRGSAHLPRRLAAATLLLALPWMLVVGYRTFGVYIDPRTVAQESTDLHEVLRACLRLPDDDLRHMASRRVGNAGPSGVAAFADVLRECAPAQRMVCLDLVAWGHPVLSVAQMDPALTDADPRVAGRAMELLHRDNDVPESLHFTAAQLVQPLRSRSPGKFYAVRAVERLPWDDQLSMVLTLLADPRLDQNIKLPFITHLASSARADAEQSAARLERLDAVYPRLAAAEQAVLLKVLANTQGLPAQSTDAAVRAYQERAAGFYPEICDSLRGGAFTHDQRIAIATTALGRCHGDNRQSETRVFIDQCAHLPVAETIALWQTAAADPAIRGSCLAVAVACDGESSSAPLARGLPLAAYASDSDLANRRQALCTVWLLQTADQLKVVLDSLPDDDAASRTLRRAVPQDPRIHPERALPHGFDRQLLATIGKLRCAPDENDRALADEALRALRDPPNDQDLVDSVVASFDRFTPDSQISLLWCFSTQKHGTVGEQFLHKALGASDDRFQYTALEVAERMRLTPELKAQVATVREQRRRR